MKLREDGFLYKLLRWPEHPVYIVRAKFAWTPTETGDNGMVWFEGVFSVEKVRRGRYGRSYTEINTYRDKFRALERAEELEDDIMRGAEYVGFSSGLTPWP